MSEITFMFPLLNVKNVGGEEGGYGKGFGTPGEGEKGCSSEEPVVILIRRRLIWGPFSIGMTGKVSVMRSE